MLRAYKYCILPTDEQKEQLAKFFGCCRFVYNLGLECKISAWTSAKKNLTCFDLANQMKDLKDNEAGWLSECPAQSLQMSLRNLDNAYTQFFKGGGFPKFKNKYSKQSIQFPQQVWVDFEKNIIKIPKLKNVTCIYDRKFEGDIKTVTLSKTTTGKYFVSILVDNHSDMPKKKPVKEETTVGIDLGIKTFATLSDGTEYANLKLLRKGKKNLRRQQRSLARKQKGSKRREKQRLVVAKVHEKIRNQRTDYLHKISTEIVKNNDTICMEDLNISGMMKNEKLSLAIAELGWYTFKTFISYKCDWYGKNLITIGRFDASSKICSNCGNIFKELKLSDRFWTCEKCKTEHDRDKNAAQNIKSFGLRGKPSNVNVSQ